MTLAPVRLDRLLTFEKIAKENGTASGDFQIKWQNAMTQIESALNSVIETQNALLAVDQALVEVDAALVAVDDALVTVDAAVVTAQSAADDAAAALAITGSYVTGVTITATDAGSNVTVNISAHTRVYADGTSVSVSAGSVTGLSYSMDYYIYYDQASRAGGVVTYQATTSQTTAAQVGDRHTVGKVTTPAAAAPDNNGDPVLPPGVGNIAF